MRADETTTVSEVDARQAHGVWRGLDRGLGVASAVVVTTMMLLTGSDVLARYVLNAPIKGAFELTEILLVCLVFLAMPLAMLSNAHVEVEIWEPKSPRGIAFRIVLGAFAALLVFGGLSWQLAEHAARLAKYGSVSNSLGIPLGLVAAFAALGCAIGALVALRRICTSTKAKS